MAEAVLEAPTDEAKVLEAEAPVADGAAEAEADAAPLIPEEAAVDAPVVVAPSITIKKIMDDGHGGAHGGAWKIALADMMTAMMAFFLLMWLLGASNADQRKSIADYFKPTSHSNVTMGKLAGSDGMLGGRSVIDPDGFPFSAKQTSALNMVTPRSQGGPTENDPSPNGSDSKESGQDGDPGKKSAAAAAAAADAANFEKMEKEIKEALAKNPKLDKLKDQVQFARDKDGLRIEIIDKADFAMFGLGTTTMTPRAQALLTEVSKTLATLPNKVAIRGHTDSVQFANTDDRNNWSLSAERAEETRKIIGKKGIPDSRFAKIEGVADTAPYNPNDPKDPRNRRISITVMNRD
ncbi:MAG: OmpA family protein [Comamonadaceae bacterium]|jgi:chemotaxis protein MotB|nr:OmpA family protein [Comamonadaceae bacterium]